MGYPSGQPAWQQQELNKLSSQGLLSGINPLVLAGVAGNESGYEVAGPGINSEGYGGFYGLGENSTYGFGGQSFTESPTILNDPGLSSFDQQSEAAAAEIASLLQANNGNLQAALASYTGGGPTNGDYELAMQNLGSAGPFSPQAGSGELVVTGTGGAPPGGGSYVAGGVPGVNAALSSTTPNANQASLSSALSGLWSPPKGMVARGLLILVGLILLKVGFDHLFESNSSPATIIVDSLPSGGGSKGMSGPGASRQSAAPATSSTEETPATSSTEEPPAKEPDHEKAEHAAEDTGEAAAVA